MPEISAIDCRTLGAFPNAGDNAWRDLLTERDRATYVRVHRALRDICKRTAARYEGRLVAVVQPSFHEASGVRNNRPKDLWCSLVNEGADDLVGMPQIFMIASGRGVEIGFAPAIHRSDFSNPEVKRALRRVTPLLFELLPEPKERVARSLAERLAETGGWYFRSKARLDPGGDFPSLDGLLQNLHTDAGIRRGAAAISRYYTPYQLNDDRLSLQAAFEEATRIFLPVMDFVRQRQKFAIAAVKSQERAGDEANEAGDQDPVPPSDAVGRKKILASITQRQGQGRFRVRLLRAYGGTCAVTGSTTLEILEAAHIRPYDGEATNQVTNGILLRSDVHTLFDLGLITIGDGYEIMVDAVVTERAYRDLHGMRLSVPQKERKWPSAEALAEHRTQALERFRG
jgi:hypothetical protein